MTPVFNTQPPYLCDVIYCRAIGDVIYRNPRMVFDIDPER